MLVSDIVFETINAITANKARSGLTVLGIVIGIASVIVMLAIGTGAQKDITEQIEGIGSNLLMVMPGAQRGFGYAVRGGGGSAETLTMEDAEIIESKIELIKKIAPVSSGRQQVISALNNTNTSITGVTESYSSVKSIEMDQGSFITAKQNSSRAKVAIIGPDTATDLFGEETDIIGEKIRINGISFSIVGISKSKGGSGMTNEDDIVYIPLSTYQQYLQGDESLSLINLEVVDSAQMTEAEKQVEELLLDAHEIDNSDDADFSIMNQSDIVEMASSATQTFTILLGAVAGISLVVGGIGIMNMMLTNVTERTREIGLRKSIGAKRKDISNQFLFEAIVLTFSGGAMGVVLGVLISMGTTKFGGITTEISFYSIVLAFGVSTLIGIIFGYYPAKRASALNPIEALRYE